MNVRHTLVAIVALSLAAPAAAFGPASDFASAAAYGDGWIDGDDGGSGWDPLYPWTFSPTQAPFVAASSTANGDGDTNGDGDIDTGGRAFGLLALNTSYNYAVRFFGAVPLQVGEHASWDFDAVGSGALYFASCSLMEYVGTPQQRFAIHVKGDLANYQVVDAGGLVDLGIPVSDEGIHVEFELTGVNSYTTRLTPLGGATTLRSGTLGGAGDIVAFFCSIGGGGSSNGGTHKAYFNSVAIPEPGALASMLAAFAALALCRKRRSA